MDFAELDVLQERRNFLMPFIDSVQDNEAEFRVVIITADCDAEKAYPVGFFANNHSSRRNMSYGLIKDGFDKFMKKTHKTIGTLVEAFQLKVDTLTMAVQDRDIEINNLTVELEQLKELIAKDKQKVQEALNKSPPLKEVYLKYQANPRAVLSTDQQTIWRLALEIKKLNGELRLALSNNLSLKNKNNLLKKQYSDKIIVESAVNQIRLDNASLRQQKEQLLDELAELNLELNRTRKLIPKPATFIQKLQTLADYYLNPFSWFDYFKKTLFQFLAPLVGFLIISSLLSLRISVPLFIFLTTLTITALALKYLGYY